MSNNESTLSKTITFLRFPLIVAVVFIHTELNHVMINGTYLVEKGQFPIHDLFDHIISREVAQIAVPLFYFISGFLFFYHTDFSLLTYGQKLKKRFHTLLIPYLFWNIVVFLLTLATQIFIPSMTSGRHKLIVDYNWLDWLNLFWGYSEGMPICYQFWFIRDLMIVILLTPLLYYLIKYCKAFGVLLLGILWLLAICPKVPGLSIIAFFFFSFGAWFSINKQDFTTVFRTMRWNATIIYMVLIALSTFVTVGSIYAHKLGIIVGLIAVISWTAYGIEKGQLRISSFLAGSSFFIYAYHGMPMTFVTKYSMKLMPSYSEWSMIANYFIIPAIIVTVGIGIYAFLRKYFPAFTAFITGGR